MAIAQIDIKRTLSHSTSAYLGLVFIAVGFGQVDIAFLLAVMHVKQQNCQKILGEQLKHVEKGFDQSNFVFYLHPSMHAL